MKKIVRSSLYLFPICLFIFLILIGELYSPKGISKINILQISSLAILYLWLGQIIMASSVNWIKRFLQVIYYFLSTIFLALPLIFSSYYLNFQQKIDEYSILAIFQTDFEEAISFLEINFSSKFFLAILPVLLLPVFLMYGSKKINHLYSQSNLKIWPIFFLIPITLFLYSNLSMVTMFSQNYKKYHEEVIAFKQLNDEIKSNKLKISGKKETKGETYVIVIGESLNKNHMSLYGYPRQTTPLLDSINKEDSLLIFQNIYSNHVHTVPVLMKALTESNQYNGKKFTSSPSIINILNAAGFETYWISNQVRYGAHDNAISVIAQNADYKYFYNKHIGTTVEIKNYDDVVLPKVKELLAQKSSNNRVIFVHLMGNHFHYYKRYPKEYSKYHPPLKKGLFGEEKQTEVQKHICEYDNSILFNDMVVSKIYKYTKKSTSTIKGFIYFSDHADDVLAGMQHHASKFTYPMTETPFIMWFSDTYQKQYQEKYERVKRHVNTYWSNDLVFNLLIGLMDITSENHDPKYDLSHMSFRLSEQKLSVLKGKRLYAIPENSIYTIKKNLDSLKKHQLYNRIIPHRVNSIGKLSDIKKAGFTSWEMDVSFKEKDDITSYYEVGHDKKSMSQLELANFLKNISTSQEAKIWLDIKRLKNKNLTQALNQLNTLSTNNFLNKKEIIIESGITDKKFSIFSEAGYHTSYYIPTKIKNTTNPIQLEKQAKKIAQQLKKQNVSAVSFDSRLFPWIKQYLEPLISKSIVYHTWDLGLRIDRTNFFSLLTQKAYFKDQRIQTILFTFPSEFHL